MDARTKKAIQIRFESWGEWYWRTVRGIGYSDKSTVSRFQDSGIGGNKGNWKKSYMHTPASKVTGKPAIPGYKASSFNSAVHKFLTDLDNLELKAREQISKLVYWTYAAHHAESKPGQLTGQELYKRCGVGQSRYYELRSKLFELFHKQVGI